MGEIQQAVNSGAKVIVVGGDKNGQWKGKSKSMAKPGATGRSINDDLGYAGKKRHFGKHSIDFKADGPDHLIITGISGSTRVLTREFLAALSSEASRLSSGRNKALDVMGTGRIAISNRFRSCK